MPPERSRPSLRVLVTGSARQAALRSEPCQTSGCDHIYQTQGLFEANLGQPRSFQLGGGYKPRFQSATANRFHEGAVFVTTEVEDTEIAIRRVPSIFFAPTEKYWKIADSMAPIPELCWWGLMYQRFSIVQVGRGRIEHELIYPPCSP